MEGWAPELGPCPAMGSLWPWPWSGGAGSFPVLGISQVTNHHWQAPAQVSGVPRSASQVPSFKRTDLGGQRPSLPFSGLQLFQTFPWLPPHCII